MRGKTPAICLLIVSSVLMMSCSGLWGPSGRQGVSSSLVDYLYPQGEVPPRHDQNVPNLKLPLTVGLAFVPSTMRHVQGLTEAHKTELLARVRQQFQGREYIRDIVVVPDTYMRSSKGFEGVEQIARLYGLDVVALVSYDQVATTAENKASLLYWTIVGAYFIKGNQNEVNTFVDTAVFDVNSHKLLLRAPGVNKLERSSTLVELEDVSRKARAEGFELAMADMTVNLGAELDRFRERIRQDNSVTITHRQGYSGAGAVHPGFLVLVCGLLLLRRFRQ